jgi:hypothetical protein
MFTVMDEPRRVVVRDFTVGTESGKSTIGSSFFRSLRYTQVSSSQ